MGRSGNPASGTLISCRQTMSGEALVSHSSRHGRRLTTLLMLKVASLTEGMTVRISLDRSRDQAPAFHDAPGGSVRAGDPSLRSRPGEPARRRLVWRAVVLGTPAPPRL